MKYEHEQVLANYFRHLDHPADAEVLDIVESVDEFALTSPLFGALGDRMSRMRLIAFGVALWSLSTAIGGSLVMGALVLVATGGTR